jgi:hypothetical protein
VAVLKGAPVLERLIALVRRQAHGV